MSDHSLSYQDGYVCDMCGADPIRHTRGTFRKTAAQIAEEGKCNPSPAYACESLLPRPWWGQDGEKTCGASATHIRAGRYFCAEHKLQGSTAIVRECK